MEQPNFFETVAAPALQQKCQEFFNLSLALETNLRVEVAKNKFLQSKLEEYEKQNQDVVTLQAQLKQAETTNLGLQSTIQSLQSTQNMAVQLKQQELDAAAQRSAQQVQELQSTYDALRNDYQKLKTTLDAVMAENEQFKTPPAPVVKTVKGKVGKPSAAPVPTFTEPDDF